MEQKKGEKEKKEKSESSSSTSLMFGKVKLTRAQKRLKKYKKSLKSIKNKNIRTNIIYLYELTKVNNKNLKDKKALDKALIYQKKLDLFVDYYNKIREIINTSDLNLINQNTKGYDEELYSINGEDRITKKSIYTEIKSNKSNEKTVNENDNNKEIKSKNSSKNNKNDINDESNKEINSKYSSKRSKKDDNKSKNSKSDSINENINSNEKLESVGPIKNFWKIALITY